MTPGSASVEVLHPDRISATKLKRFRNELKFCSTKPASPHSSSFRFRVCSCERPQVSLLRQSALSDDAQNTYGARILPSTADGS